MIVSMLAGLGHRLRHLLRAAGLAKSTYYHLLSHPAAVTRPDIEPMVAEIFARTPNGCGHRQIRMCLVHEFGVRVSHKSVLKVMRRMGLECRIRRPNPYRKYSSYRGRDGREGGEPAEPRLHGRPAVGEAGHGRHRVQGRRRQGVSGSRIRHGIQGDRGLGRQPASRHGPAAAPARHARGEAARRRRPDPALRLSRVCC